MVSRKLRNHLSKLRSKKTKLNGDVKAVKKPSVPKKPRQARKKPPSDPYGNYTNVIQLACCMQLALSSGFKLKDVPKPPQVDNTDYKKQLFTMRLRHAAQIKAKEKQIRTLNFKLAKFTKTANQLSELNNPVLMIHVDGQNPHGKSAFTILSAANSILTLQPGHGNDQLQKIVNDLLQAVDGLSKFLDCAGYFGGVTSSLLDVLRSIVSLPDISRPGGLDTPTKEVLTCATDRLLKATGDVSKPIATYKRGLRSMKTTDQRAPKCFRTSTTTITAGRDRDPEVQYLGSRPGNPPSHRSPTIVQAPGVSVHQTPQMPSSYVQMPVMWKPLAPVFAEKPSSPPSTSPTATAQISVTSVLDTASLSSRPSGDGEIEMESPMLISQ